MSVDLLNHISVDAFFHRPDDPVRIAKTANVPLYKLIPTKMPANVKYVFNITELGNIDFMFYNKGMTAYDKYITEEQFNVFKQRNIPIAYFPDHGSNIVPDFIKNYANAYPITIKLYE